MIKAVLDACVLYSAPLRGLLLSLASAGLMEPFWTIEIQNEWTRSLLRNRPDLNRQNIERTCRRMDIHFPRGLIRGYESLISALTLPDPDDRHVLAVAIHTKADYIITFNLTDFPATILQQYGIEAVLPDTFVCRLIQKMPDRVLRAVKNHRLSLTRPSKTAEEYLETLEKQGLAQTVAFLGKYKTDI